MRGGANPSLPRYAFQNSLYPMADGGVAQRTPEQENHQKCRPYLTSLGMGVKLKFQN